jgi:hypothetical protein
LRDEIKAASTKPGHQAVIFSAVVLAMILAVAASTVYFPPSIQPGMSSATSQSTSTEAKVPGCGTYYGKPSGEEGLVGSTLSANGTLTTTYYNTVFLVHPKTSIVICVVYAGSGPDTAPLLWKIPQGAASLGNSVATTDLVVRANSTSVVTNRTVSYMLTPSASATGFYLVGFPYNCDHDVIGIGTSAGSANTTLYPSLAHMQFTSCFDNPTPHTILATNATVSQVEWNQTSVILSEVVNSHVSASVGPGGKGETVMFDVLFKTFSVPVNVSLLAGPSLFYTFNGNPVLSPSPTNSSCYFEPLNSSSNFVIDHVPLQSQQSVSISDPQISIPAYSQAHYDMTLVVNNLSGFHAVDLQLAMTSNLGRAFDESYGVAFLYPLVTPTSMSAYSSLDLSGQC